MNAAKDKILIVDDDSAIRWTLGEALRSWNYDSMQAGSLSEARKLFADEEPGIALLDIDLPDGSGLDFLNEIKAQNPDAIVIMITGNVQISNTIAALRGGAHDFIGKPVRLEELRVTLRNSIETKNLRREVKLARNERAREFSFDEIIGDSPAILKAKDLAQRVAESDVSAVLLQGESGSGKDVFARAIHYASERRGAPFVAINCAALPANLIESELFGHEKGAFTDAKNKKQGLFEQADGGTVFLDEIGEMDIGLQAKLLRVLEENVFRRVGGTREIPLDLRVIAASNRDLKTASEAGEFRLDLFFRLSIIQIDIPPLRARGDDVLLLAQYYIDKLSRKRGKKLKALTPEVARIFQQYDWAGNVRELRNVIERASILEDGEFVTTEFLPFDLKGKSGATAKNDAGAGDSAASFVLPKDGIPLEDVELMLAQQAMDRTGGNLTRAAKLLHISRDQLRYKLKKND